MEQASGKDVVVDCLSCELRTKLLGETKVRLATYPRRSGDNGRCKIHERVLLPHILVWVFGILGLRSRWQGAQPRLEAFYVSCKIHKKIEAGRHDCNVFAKIT